ncbi:MAG: hypothetical protein ACI82Z_001615 [Cellvibrionaceae bacterium]|jgi:hypothetical protein
MTLLATLLLALLICSALFALFLWLKNPWYRVDAERMLRVIELVLTGQATINHWYATFGMTIRHNSELELIRLRCIEVEEKHLIDNDNSGYLFEKAGLDTLEAIRLELKSLSNHG